MVKRITLTIILAFTSLLLFPEVGTAQTITPKGITISPAYQQVTIAGNETQKKIHLSITNDNTVVQTIKVTFSDFNTLNESGGLFFVGSNPTNLQKKYGLTKWISIEPNSYVIQPRQTVAIDAIVQNLPTLSSGGHYGAINLTAVTSQLESANNNVAIHPVASSLIFLTKQGGDTHKLKLQDVAYDGNIFKLPNLVTLKFQNTGNTHLIPRGFVTISDSSNKVISHGIINENSGIILPETFRQFSVTLQNNSRVKLVGKYKLKVVYRFDGYVEFRQYEKTITHIDLTIILGVVVFIILAGVLALKLRRLNLPLGIILKNRLK